MTPQLPILEEDWLPLRAAEKFDFDLPYIVGNDTRVYFRLLSWLTGCVGDSAGKLIRNMRQKGTFGNAPFQKSHLIVPEKDSVGRDQDFEYVTDELLYRITEDLRATKDRPVVSQIKDYLAKSGAFVDKVRRETALIAPPKSRKEVKYLAKQIVYEHKDKTAAMATLQRRRDLIDSFKAMMGEVNRVCEKPRYGDIANAEYIAVFGYTAKDLRRILNTDSVRDALTDVELSGLQLLEVSMQQKLAQVQSMSNEEIIRSLTRIAGSIRQVLNEVEGRFNQIEATGKPLLKERN